MTNKPKFPVSPSAATPTQKGKPSRRNSIAEAEARINKEVWSRRYVPAPPPVKPVEHADPSFTPGDIRKQEFARRLRQKMKEKGWKQIDLARAIAAGGSDQLDRSSVSYYVSGRSLPRPAMLYQIAKALGVEESELLPKEMQAQSHGQAAPIEIKSIGEGMAWVRMSLALPFSVAVEVVRLAQEHAP